MRGGRGEEGRAPETGYSICTYMSSCLPLTFHYQHMFYTVYHLWCNKGVAFIHSYGQGAISSIFTGVCESTDKPVNHDGDCFWRRRLNVTHGNSPTVPIVLADHHSFTSCHRTVWDPTCDVNINEKSLLEFEAPL